MQILYELVTVISKQKLIDHWETGKMADAMVWTENYKPGDLPGCCAETFVSDHE